MFNHQWADIQPIKQVNTDEGRFYETPFVDVSINYPSITRVLGETKDKSALLAWRRRVGEEEANKISKAATTRGTAMHNLCEKYLKNEELTDEGSTLGEMLFRTIRPSLDRINNIRALETGLYSHKLKVAGTVDCIGEIDGELAIIDFKTSSKPKKEEYIDDYYRQGLFYFRAYHELTGELPKKVVILIAIQDGSMQEFTLKGKQLIEWNKEMENRVESWYYNNANYAI